MNTSTKILVFFKYLFISFIQTCIFPAVCFRQGAYIAQGFLIPYSMSLELIRAWSLGGFQLVMVLYRGHFFLFFSPIVSKKAQDIHTQTEKK